MRYYLDGLAQIGSLTLLGYHGIVYLSGGYIVGLGCVDTQKTLVVSQVKVGLGAVVGNIALSVLVGIERSGVYVDVGVELLDCNPETSGLQQLGQ